MVEVARPSEYNLRGKEVGLLVAFLKIEKACPKF